MVFREWLERELGRQGISRRELARRLAAPHPKGVTPETVDTYRGAIKRYLNGSMSPTNPTRAAFADALGVDRGEVPSVEDEEEAEDMVAPLMRELQKLQHRISELEGVKA